MAPAMNMSRESVDQYTEKMRERYSRMTGKQARSVLLDEFIAVTNFERKYAIKVLGKKRRKLSKTRIPGRKPTYSSATKRVLKALWLVMDQPCGKRMKDMLPIWMKHRKRLKETTRKELLTMRVATIDRILKPHKVTKSRRVSPPRGDSAIKSAVEMRAESWDTKEPGWTEIDTVAHCGGGMSGSFAWTLTSVDIKSGWSEVRIIWNCGQHATLQGLEDITAAQPFDLLGVDSDNGGELLNYHLYRLPEVYYGWCLQKEIKQPARAPTAKTIKPTSSKRTTPTSVSYLATSASSTKKHSKASTKHYGFGASGKTSTASQWSRPPSDGKDHARSEPTPRPAGHQHSVCSTALNSMKSTVHGSTNNLRRITPST